mgnify:CR=1 FL=1
MANEAVNIEGYGYPDKEPLQYTVANAVAISKGTFLKIVDVRTASAGNLVTFPRSFAGFASADKEAGDGATKIAVNTKGVYDLVAGGAITAGDLVMMSGGNVVSTPESQAVFLAALSGGRIIGKALETATDAEVIAVSLGL